MNLLQVPIVDEYWQDAHGAALRSLEYGACDLLIYTSKFAHSIDGTLFLVAFLKSATSKGMHFAK